MLSVRSNGLSWSEKSVKYLGVILPLNGVNKLSIMNANFSAVWYRP